MPKILFVDDEPDLLEFYRSYLSRRKYQVLTSSNRSEAIESIKKESPDIVFCDIRLETDIAGLEILEEAKKIEPDIVVYLITGLMERDIEEKGLSLGAKEVLHKPISHQMLEEKIKEVVEKE